MVLFLKSFIWVCFLYSVFLVQQDITPAKDKQETAQWFASPSTIKAILEASLAKVSTFKGQACIIHHKTMYDGTFEKAGTWLVMCLGLALELLSSQGCLFGYSCMFLVVCFCFYALIGCL